MLARLAKMYQRHQELEQQLADPKIISDHRKLQSLGKEHASLTAASEAYVSYQALATEIKQTEELVQEEADDELHELAKEELRALKAQEAMLTEQIKILLLPKDPNDDKNIILEIRGAVGGDEAALFAAVLYRMYVRFAERHGWTTEVLSLNDTGIGGLKEAIISIQGKGVFRELKYESGAHRVQRVPTTESGGRLHTSTATVAVLPEVAEVELTIHEKDIRVDTFCSSGPGGQSVNTTKSAVRITYLPTGMSVSCQDEKSQLSNKDKAMRVLRARLLDLKQQEEQAKQDDARKSAIGSGDRSERIRTYNFPQNRVTDHRIGLTLRKLDQVVDGDLEDIIDALKAHDQSEKLKGN